LQETVTFRNGFFLRASAEVEFDFSAHDLRRTIATVTSELGYDLNSIGMLLNHAKKKMLLAAMYSKLKED
jgi:site-specific recombinase XerD